MRIGSELHNAVHAIGEQVRSYRWNEQRARPFGERTRDRSRHTDRGWNCMGLHSTGWCFLTSRTRLRNRV